MTTWLIDKSALVRLGESLDSREWASRIQRGLVRITTVTRLEVGYSARTAADLARFGELFGDLADPEIMDRAWR